MVLTASRNLGPGSYTVQEVVPAGSTQTGGIRRLHDQRHQRHPISSGNNFDNFQNISISGTKYNDITGNSFSGDDVGQGGVTINLYLNGGQHAGRFHRHRSRWFLQLHATSDRARIRCKKSFRPARRRPADCGGYTISATSGSNSSGNNFDNFQNISITGTKFNDITGNSFSGDDVGQGGVTINLYLNGGSTPVASTVTAADGSYSFTQPRPGQLHRAGSRSGRLRRRPAAWAATRSAPPAASNSSGNNFDNFQNISISGTKYNDITGNSFSG